MIYFSPSHRKSDNRSVFFSLDFPTFLTIGANFRKDVTVAGTGGTNSSFFLINCRPAGSRKLVKSISEILCLVTFDLIFLVKNFNSDVQLTPSVYNKIK